MTGYVHITPLGPSFHHCNMQSFVSPSKGLGAEAEYDELDGFNSDDDDPNVFKIRDSLEQASGVTYTTKQLHGSFS